MNLSNEIKFLLYICIAHFLVIITSIYLNYLGTKEFYYYSESYYGISKYSLIFLIIFILIPLSLIIIPRFYHKKRELMNFLKIICFIFIYISLTVGLLINISIWKAAVSAETFLTYCPYHFTLSLLNSIIEKKSNKKKFCEIRACFLYSENEDIPLGYHYICNFNSYNDLKSKNNGKIYKRINSLGNVITSDSFIKCQKIANLWVSGEENSQYFDICSKNHYYECRLFEKPKEEEYTSVNNKDSCPGGNYNKTAYLLGASYVLIDIICFLFLFFIEYLIMKKILSLIQFGETHQSRENQATINSTVNNNNNQQNSNNIDNNQEFKKEPTETIIVGPAEDKNDEIFFTPKRSGKKLEKHSENENDNDNINTNITNKEGKRMINLKSTSNIKLLNINFMDSDRKNSDSNKEDNKSKNDLEIVVNNSNENIKNKKLKILSNQETFFQSIDAATIQVKSNMDKTINPVRIYLNTGNNNITQKININRNKNNDTNINEQQTQRFNIHKKE